MDKIITGYPDMEAIKAVLDYAKGFDDAGVSSEMILLPIVETDTGISIAEDCCLMCDSSSGGFTITVDTEVDRFEVSDIKGKFDTHQVMIDLPGSASYLCDKKNASYVFRKDASGSWWWRRNGARTRAV